MAPSILGDIEQSNGLAAAGAAGDVRVTAFICVNCTRSGVAPSSGGRPRPIVPGFDWPFAVREVLMPCTGRIQPEHLLKAFESGSDLVCAVACEEGNCHYLEGSTRCARRVESLRGVLDEVGLGGDRLLLFHLPGSAREDMELGAGRPGPAVGASTVVSSDPASDSLHDRISAIREAVSRALEAVAPNPLQSGPVDGLAEQRYQELDTSDEANED